MKKSILVDKSKYAPESISGCEDKTDLLATQQNSTVIEYVILFILGVLMFLGLAIILFDL